MRLEIAPRAEADLDEIFDYIAADHPSRARTFIDELERDFMALLDFPDSGRDRSDLSAGLRSKPHGKYLLFYTRQDAKIRIERVIHGARDLGGLFGEV